MTTQPAFRTLIDALRHWARTRPDNRAYAFIDDQGRERAGLTFAQLDRRARRMAGELAGDGKPGDRVFLLFEPGIEFLVGFFACLYAGMVAVPVLPPRRNRLRDATAGIFADCMPTIGLTGTRSLAGVQDGFAGVPGAEGLRWLTVDLASEPGSAADVLPAAPCDVAFLQYTSGSTSAPKGVVVGHDNLLANMDMIVHSLGTTANSIFVSWVPLYHDMGLILNALHALYLGAGMVLMTPVSFMQRPLAWLWAISRYKADFAAAPNFAYDLCVSRLRPESVVGLDLSCWRVAANAAEPVRAETMSRFADAFAPYGFLPGAFHPCYGMAEATVFVSGMRLAPVPAVKWLEKAALQQHKIAPAVTGPHAQAVVSCGRPAPHQRVAIVGPKTRRRCPPGEIGEIWIAGPHVARGYWGDPPVGKDIFGARIADTDDGPFLRTGDLGFVEDDEIYVTGRFKDIIIIRGANYYPQDIERAAERAHAALRPHCCAVFTVEREGSEALVVVQEVERTSWRKGSRMDIVGAIRQAVVTEFDLFIHDVVLIRPGTSLKTTSGKIRRQATRAAYLGAKLEAWTDEADGDGDAAESDEGSSRVGTLRSDAPAL